MRRFAASVTLALTVAALRPAASAAQAYGVYEQGACAMGRAGAGVAAPCADGSAMFFNPAGLVGTAKRFSVGAAVSRPQGSFTNDNTGLGGDLKDALYAVPNVYITGPVSDDVAIGLGVFSPYQLSTEWDREAFEGRFLGYRSVIRGLVVQPTIAAKLGPVSVGGGLDFANVSFKFQRRLDLATQRVPSATLPPGTTFASLGIPAQTDFADASVSGSGWNLGAHVGLAVELHPRVRLGARYMTKHEVGINDAEARFTAVSSGLVLTAGNPFGLQPGTPVEAILAGNFQTGGTLTTQRAATTITLPAQLVLGLAVKPTDRLALLLDAQQTSWSDVDQLAVDLARGPDQRIQTGYRDVWTFRLGGELVVNPARATTVRAGYFTHAAAAPSDAVTPNIPEGSRTGFSLGVGTRLGGLATLDLAYMYTDQADRRGRSTAGAVNGLYLDQNAHSFGASFVFDF